MTRQRMRIRRRDESADEQLQAAPDVDLFCLVPSTDEPLPAAPDVDLFCLVPSTDEPLQAVPAVNVMLLMPETVELLPAAPTFASEFFLDQYPGRIRHDRRKH